MNYKGFHHLSWEKRLQIEALLKAKTPKKEIAQIIGVCLSTIYKEIKRGLCTQLSSDYVFEQRYCPEVAEKKYRQYLAEKGCALKIGKDHALVRHIEEKIIHEHFSPGAVLGQIAQGEFRFSTRICVSTLYNYIYRGDVFLHLSAQHLHNKGRWRRKNKEPKLAARAPRGTSISRRPQNINQRTEFGHWEMDSVVGTQGTSCALVVLTERLTRKGLIFLVPDHTASSVKRALNGLERRLGSSFYRIFKSITVDNGCEFRAEDIEQSCRRKSPRTQVYYCHPYSPYERGSNENMNRIIRRFFPKGTNFDTVSAAQVKQAEQWLNRYPRKILQWQCADALYAQYVAQATA